MSDEQTPTGHAAVAAALKAARPLPAAHAEISRIFDTCVRLADDGSLALLKADGRTPMLDSGNGWAAASPEHFAARLRRDRPELFEKSADAAPAPAAKPTTMTDAFVKAKQGHPSAFAALEGPKPVNLTNLFEAAKLGDAAALAAIDAMLKAH